MLKPSNRPRFRTNEKPTGQNDALPYRRRGPLLSAAEQRFFQAVEEGTKGRWHLSYKVRLTDLIESKDGFFTPSGAKISQRHVDGVLVCKKSWKVIAAIELDDASHNDPDQQIKDAYLGDALYAGGIPLIRFPARRSYDPKRIAGLIYGVLKRHPLATKPRRRATKKPKAAQARRFWRKPVQKSNRFQTA